MTGGKAEKKYEAVSEGLKSLYKEKLLPLETEYNFHAFHSPVLDDQDFSSKPMVMLAGQYSTGKTTFIRHLLGKDFPGIRIGPEPTTDKFIVLMKASNEVLIPGHALVSDPTKHFKPLSKFGNGFLNRFECSNSTSPVLQEISILDTPGILSGEKQRTDRGYDFTGVLEWFAERVDRILLLFDAHKLDISDEFRWSIEALKGHGDKIRIVLNKADMVDHQALMRVYGALMWSLGKVLPTPEVARVYIGSFWDQPLTYDANRKLFQAEEQDLFQDLQALPRTAVLRKLSDMIKRARLAKVHALIISKLQEEMPYIFCLDSKKVELIKNLDQVYAELQSKFYISPGDFPELAKMKKHLEKQDFTKFRSYNYKLLQRVDKMLAEDFPKLMAMIPLEEANRRVAGTHEIVGGAFAVAEDSNPFEDGGLGEQNWEVGKDREAHLALFTSLNPIDGKVTCSAAKSEMVKSKLPNLVLSKIWKLADVDQDGFLDADEFCLAMYLISIKLSGGVLPSEVPHYLVPAAKQRRRFDPLYNV